MASGTLYTYPESTRAFKVLIAAKYSGASVSVSPNFRLGETNKSDAFLKKFPLGKVPAFEGSDGTLLFESNAIANYVANAQLRGTTERDQALVQQFISLADNEIEPAAATWVFPTLGIIQFNKQNTERAKEDLKKVLNYLNEYLKTRTFLVGERITLADISVVCNLLLLYKQVLDPSFRQPFGNVNRYFVTVVNQPQFKSVLGDVKLAEKMAQFDAKKYSELSGGSKKDKKKEDKKEAKKPKQEKSKKEVKEEPEEEAPKPVKKVDPFAELPNTDFVLDDWKKKYSNFDTIKVALPYFWENYDKEGWSLWYAEYMYPEDFNRIFMACNLVGGMFQRLEKMKKHAFGNVCVFGTNETPISISGVWLWRGHKLIFELDENWGIDYSSYSWRKLNPELPEDKTLIEEHWSEEGQFGGRKFNQGKCFK